MTEAAEAEVVERSDHLSSSYATHFCSIHAGNPRPESSEPSTPSQRSVPAVSGMTGASWGALSIGFSRPDVLLPHARWAA